MRPRLSLLLLLAAAPLVACPAAPRPPENCRPGAVAALRFEDVSDDWGLRALAADGNRLSTADIDGDGSPDLAISRGSGSGERDDFTDSAVLRRRFLLRNTGSGFEDVTRSSGFAATRTDAAGASTTDSGRAYSYALFGDVDNDGDVDAVTITETWEVDADSPDTGDRSEVLLNNGDGTFALVDIAAERSDIATAWSHSTAATLLDADRDGRLDLFVGNQYGVFGNHATNEQDRLYLGRDGGRLSDKTDDAALTTSQGGSRNPANTADYTDADGGNVSWQTFGVVSCDIDRDGDTDLITQTYGRGLNQLWLNAGDGTFTNATAGSGWSRDSGDDYATDERFRCYCANEGTGAPDCAGVDPPRIGCSPGQWLPGWDDAAHRLGGNTFSAVCGDLDGDGDNDLATGEIRHWWTPGASDSSTIAWNDGGSPPRFTRQPHADVGIEQIHDTTDWNEGDLTVGAFDFDNDGHLDLLRPQSDYPDTRLYLYRNRGDGTFEEVAEDARIDFPRAAGMAVADFDLDGDLDVATSFSRMRCDANCAYTTPEVHLFRNERGNDANALQIRLRGSGRGGTNVSGVGAEVRVTAGGITQVRELSAGNGHQGVQNTLMLHFGLAGECTAESVEVRWNDAAGTVQTFEDVPANYPVTLVEGVEQPQWPTWDGGE